MLNVNLLCVVLYTLHHELTLDLLILCFIVHKLAVLNRCVEQVGHLFPVFLKQNFNLFT